MGLANEVPAGSAIALDTDCLIYYVEEHGLYLQTVEPLMEQVIAGVHRAHVSVVTLLEVLVLPLRSQRNELVSEYRDILTDETVVALHYVDVDISLRAAEIRARYRLEVADSIIAATAIEAGCTHLVTNNNDDFKRVPGLNVLAIDNFV
jgi:predicted nucleic acid-binding protein